MGFFVVFIPAAIIISREKKCSDDDKSSTTTTTSGPATTSGPTTPSGPTTTSGSTTTGPPRNDSDYQSNSEYYQQLADSHDFTQLDNLRLDRLSSPRFHPINGNSVLYLRTQYHMPDLNGSTATLHWFDIGTNKTVQLTEPIWGIYDQQVIKIQ